MKIKLSKTKWEAMGKKHGWLTTAQSKTYNAVTVYELNDRLEEMDGDPRFQTAPAPGYIPVRVEVEAFFDPGFPGSMLEPQENKEWEITSVSVVKTGEDVTKYFENPASPNYQGLIKLLDQTGLDKQAQTTSATPVREKCNTCKGAKWILNKSLQEVCPSCNGKGYRDEQDIAAENHRQGIGPCPWGNDCKCESHKE